MPDRLTGPTLVIATGHELSLALLDEGLVLAETRQAIERGHAEALMPAVAGLLAPFGGRNAAIARIVVEVGPGSFTGLRVGIAAAQALALSWGASVQGVRSTQLVAADARAAGIAGALFVVLAAPRGQIWAEAFPAGSLSQTGDVVALSIAEAHEAAEAISDCHIIGSGAPLIGGTEPALAPRAAAVVNLADSDLIGAEPLYVRAGEKHAIS